MYNTVVWSLHFKYSQWLYVLFSLVFPTKCLPYPLHILPALYLLMDIVEISVSFLVRVAVQYRQKRHRSQEHEESEEEPI